MKILITGAKGFLGTASVRAALARGHEVAALVRGSSERLRDFQITRIAGDLENPDWIALEKFGAEACLHAAWIATPGEYLTSPANRDFLTWSTAFLSRLAAIGMQHSVVLGTCIEYAPQRTPLREDMSPLAPATPYAQAKDELRRALERRILPHCWARIFYPYGPGEDPRRLATSIIRRTLKKEDIILKTPDSVKDYIFVDDVAAALLAAVEKRALGALNIGTGLGVTVREIATAIAKILGKPARIAVPEVVPDPYDHIVADPARLHALGWQPRTSLTDGLTELVRTLTA